MNYENIMEFKTINDMLKLENRHVGLLCKVGTVVFVLQTNPSSKYTTLDNWIIFDDAPDTDSDYNAIKRLIMKFVEFNYGPTADIKISSVSNIRKKEESTYTFTVQYWVYEKENSLPMAFDTFDFTMKHTGRIVNLVDHIDEESEEESKEEETK